MKSKNPILDELHATRERLLAESGGTISGLLARLQDEQSQSNRPRFQGQASKPSTGKTKSSNRTIEKNSP